MEDCLVRHLKWHPKYFLVGILKYMSLKIIQPSMTVYYYVDKVKSILLGRYCNSCLQLAILVEMTSFDPEVDDS